MKYRIHYIALKIGYEAQLWDDAEGVYGLMLASRGATKKEARKNLLEDADRVRRQSTSEDEVIDIEPIFKK